MDTSSALVQRLAPVMVIAAALAGCAVPRYDGFRSDATAIAASDLPDTPEAPRSLPLYAGHTGEPIQWDDLLVAIDWADVIVIGEQHDDGMGHALQLALVEDALDRWPRSLVAMEMLERDEQVLADDYLSGIIDAEDFARLTFSTNWGGEDGWKKWYQPIVDAAGDRGARVIATNAPRRYVRLARTHGYSRLRALPPDRRSLFELPRATDVTEYRNRFGEVMRHFHDEASGNTDEDDAHITALPETDEAALDARIDAAFRSQRVWDATMADSIHRAIPSRARKVIHLVGQFHSDFEGGLIRELRARGLMPRRILTISMQREWQITMRPEDRGRADIIIYTGHRTIDEESGNAQDTLSERPSPSTHENADHP